MISSLYTGATGLKSHGEGMGVISGNLSNVNTIGYKQLSMQYADLMSQYMTTSGGNLTGMPQVGLGAAPGAVRTLFEQGGVETGSAATDLRINGTGFFGVTHDGQTRYTRAGNFRFDKDGALLDTSGWTVVGRPIVNGVEGNAQPIVLNTGQGGVSTLPGKGTTVLSSSSKLGGLTDKSADPANPFFSLASAYDGTATPPLPSGSYGYSETVEFYDSKGTRHSGTLYYDLAGTENSKTAVEYVLAMNPSEDGSALGGTSASGLLMAGTVTFASDGTMCNLTAFSPPASGNPADMSGWTPASIVGGQPAFSVQFTGAEEAQTIALNMGYSYGENGSTGGGAASAADLTANAGLVYTADTGAVLGDKPSVAYGDNLGGLMNGQDGYAEGGLTEVVVGANGVISGVYSNGQSQDLYRVSLYRFTSQDGLRHEGNNQYSATKESGPANEGVPGEDSFGSLDSYALEQSNVDYAREFSLLIITQRGFQMNSKVITTSDTMLQKALEMKVR